MNAHSRDHWRTAFERQQSVQSVADRNAWKADTYLSQFSHTVSARKNATVASEVAANPSK